MSQSTLDIDRFQALRLCTPFVVHVTTSSTIRAYLHLLCTSDLLQPWLVFKFAFSP